MPRGPADRVKRICRGQLVRIHPVHRAEASVEGAWAGQTRTHYLLTDARIDDGGIWHEMLNQRLRIAKVSSRMIEEVA